MTEKRYEVRLRPLWVDDAIKRKIDIGKVMHRRVNSVTLSCTAEQRRRIVETAVVDQQFGSWHRNRDMLTAARGVQKRMAKYGVFYNNTSCPTCGQPVESVLSDG